LLFLVLLILMAQEVFRFEVHSVEERIDAPVSVTLDGINYNTDKGTPVLYELTPDGEIQVPCQLEPGILQSCGSFYQELHPKAPSGICIET
jgi:hypothetical protein